MSKLLTRERLEELKREHVTQVAVAKAAGVSRSTILRLSRRYGMQWQAVTRLQGNEAWKALG